MDWQGISYLLFVILRYNKHGEQLGAVCQGNNFFFRTAVLIVDYVLDLVIGYSLLLGWRQERRFAQQWDYRFSAQLVSYLFKDTLQAAVGGRERK